MRIFVLSLVSLVFSASAYAKCIPVPDEQAEVKIDKISSPVYDAKGKEFEGCILHTEGKVLGYAKEEGLCHSPLGSNLKVHLSHGCCDTGSDFGDAECIVRSKSSSTDSVHGNGMLVHSAK